MTKNTVPAKKMRLVATGSRLVVGALLAAGLVAGAILVAPLALPEIRHTPPQVTVSAAASDSLLVCSGPFRVLGRNAADASEMQAALAPQTQIGSLGTVPELAALEVADLAGEQTVQVVPVPADQATDAAQSFTLEQPDLRGFAAGACRPPSMQAWIVGGAASVGTSDVLTLSNPGDVASRVRLTTYGGEESTSQSVLVPPRTQTGVALASGGAGTSTPVVRVDAEGAPIHAALQSSLTRTLDPSGVDAQDSAGLPETELLFAGVRVEARSQDELMRVRLFAPEEATEARVSVRVAGALSDAQPPQTVSLNAGEPIEIPFSDLPVGTYTVHVQADEPLVGAVWQATGAHIGSDFAWMTPAPELSGTVLAAVPTGARAQLHLANPGISDLLVSVRDLDGATRQLTVPAEGSSLLYIDAGRTFEIQADAAIHAAISMYGPDRIAGWPLWPAAQEQPDITVYP